MFFDNWMSLSRTLVLGIGAYIGLVLLLRISGKRTLSKWNMFDFVVTVALGSTLATVLLSKDTTLVQGILAFAVLIFLQLIITWLSARLTWFHKLVKAQPALLLYRGEYQREVLKRERVTESEVRAALRAHGMAAVEQAEAVVLETDGSFNVIKRLDPAFESSSESTLIDVEYYPGPAESNGA